jgi:hypothetical protein
MHVGRYSKQSDTDAANVFLWTINTWPELADKTCRINFGHLQIGIGPNR